VAASSPGPALWLYGEWVRTGFVPDRRRPQSRVAILHEDSYTGPLDRALIEGIRLFDLNLRGKTVLLKPNLVEYIPGAEVNTNPPACGSGGERLPRPWSENPACRRRTRPSAGYSPGSRRGGLEAELRERSIRFVDINRDEIRKVPLQTSFTGLDCLWLPRVLTSDFIVSMPKVKTHHWAGVTINMKKPVRRGAWRCLRLAEKPAALEGH
jgi:uncharacterized protein (DUF362 family)